MLKHISDRFETSVSVVAGVMPTDTLFIHGNLASNRWWMPAVEVLLSQRHTRVQPGSAYLAEWRGCGQSSRGLQDSDLEIPKLARQYIELIQDLGGQPVDVVGHSTGGLIALYVALQAPELVRRMVLLDPVAPKGFQVDAALLDAFRAMRSDRGQCQAVMASTIHNVDTSSLLFQGVVDDAFSVDPCVWTGIPLALAQASAMDQMSKVAHGVRVIHGELDPVLPKSDSEELARALPRGEYVEVAGHGHSLNLEDPAKFVELMLGHLS